MNSVDILLQKNVIDRKKAAELQDRLGSASVGADELILQERVIDEDSLFSFKSEALGIPLRSVEEDVPLEVLKLIPEDSAEYYHMAPLSRRENELEVGMVYPEDRKAQEALKFLARQGGFRYRVSLIPVTAFERIVKQYRNAHGEVKEALAELEQTARDREGSEPRRLERLVEDAPVTKMVAVILRNAVEGSASDIHVEPFEGRLRVRFRSLGSLHSSLVLPLRVHQAIVARIKILAGMRIDETRIPQDGRFSAPINGKTVDFRVSTLPTSEGEKVAIRVLDPEAGIKTFEQLGLDGSNLQKVRAAALSPYGMILATGPTGSGKTTTLYAILQQLNKEGVNIVSLEDPVEYHIAGINQAQVKPELGFDFPQGLRQVLRQDPDIIMVGEIRDEETAGLAVNAALTGHLVLSTLHTNDALGVIPRLLDMNVKRYLIPTTLIAAMSQRLVRRLCDSCKERIQAPEQIRTIIQKEMRMAPPEFQKLHEAQLAREGGVSIWRPNPRGCKECHGSGFSGRLGIFEVLLADEEIQEAILEWKGEGNLRQRTRAQGMVSMRLDGFGKVLDGRTTFEEVVQVTKE